MLGKSLQTRDRPETLFRVYRCARKCRPGHSGILRLEDVASVAPSIKVEILHLSTPHVVAAACPCGRTLRSWSDVFPCGTAVRGRWTRCSCPRLHEREGARRAAVRRVAPTGRTCPQAPGGIWPDGNTGGNDNYPVCLRHSGQQSHTSIVYCRVCPGFAVVPAIGPHV